MTRLEADLQHDILVLWTAWTVLGAGRCLTFSTHSLLDSQWALLHYAIGYYVLSTV